MKKYYPGQDIEKRQRISEVHSRLARTPDYKYMKIFLDNGGTKKGLCDLMGYSEFETERMLLFGRINEAFDNFESDYISTLNCYNERDLVEIYSEFEEKILRPLKEIRKNLTEVYIFLQKEDMKQRKKERREK